MWRYETIIWQVKVFFQTIHKSFLKDFIILFKRINFVKKFSSPQKEKAIHNHSSIAMVTDAIDESLKYHSIHS